MRRFFISRPDLKLTVSEATMFCSGLDMKIASPENQDEHDKLESFLYQEFLFDFDKVWIETYRSENVTNCLAFVEKSSVINVTTGEINSAMVEMSCDVPNQFICEKTFEQANKKVVKGDVRFIRPIYHRTDSNSTKKTAKLLHLSQNFLQTTWIKAQLICKAFGMDLFAPDHEDEMIKVIDLFADTDEDLPNNLHIGVTNMNMERTNNWYFITNGRSLKYKMSFDQAEKLKEDEKHCLMLKKRNGKFVIKKVDCTTQRGGFICQENVPSDLNGNNSIELISFKLEGSNGKRKYGS